jgi:hypothetical protein
MLNRFSVSMRKRVTNVMNMNRKKSITQPEIVEEVSFFKRWAN